MHVTQGFSIDYKDEILYRAISEQDLGDEFLRQWTCSPLFMYFQVRSFQSKKVWEGEIFVMSVFPQNFRYEGLVSLFNGISIFIGYFMPKPFF